MCLCVTSCLLQLAMTGELSLTGKVLAVGGVKEKLLAARRCGAQAVVLPAACRRDVQSLPAHVTASLDVHYVTTYAEVFKVAFSDSFRQSSMNTTQLRAHPTEAQAKAQARAISISERAVDVSGREINKRNKKRAHPPTSRSFQASPPMSLS